MSCFLVILFLSLTLSSVSEASHDKKHPSAVVVGTVYCDTCFQQDFSMSSHFISGASVAVECKDGNSKPRFWKEARTDEHGEFKVQLPFSVSKHVKRIKGCTVKLISSSEPYCAVASAAISSSLRLKSRKQGEHIFSAGFFSFKPLKQPILCNQKPSIQKSKEPNSVKSIFPPYTDPTFPPPLQDPTTPGGLPPLPRLPGLPQLPPLPSLPGLPWAPPVTGRAKDSNLAKSSNQAQFSDRKVAHSDSLSFPPNPFLPPPTVPSPFQPPSSAIPNPFQPPNPPPVIPNYPFLPPPSGPSPSFPFPPIPGAIPSPPVLPFPFPPLFPPPGTTAPSSSKKTSP